jgi:hypothetical protein
MKDGKFEVGDKVLNICSEGVHKGQVGTVTEVNDDGYEVWAKYSDGQSTFMRSTDYKLVTASITIFGSKYEIIRKITGDTIWDYGKYSKCQEWCNAVVATYFDAHPKHLQWLIDHGYLKKVEKEKVKKTVVVEDVYWAHDYNTNITFPTSFSANWKNFVGKPNMKMTLEWEE